MAREHWQDLDDERRRERPRDDYGQADYSEDYAYDPRRRADYRAEQGMRPHGDDFGQVDYSTTYGYDLDRGLAYRRYSSDDPVYVRRASEGDDRRVEQPRSFIDRAGAIFSPPHHAAAARPHVRRRAPSDRVLWAVIMERLDAEHRLDLRDVQVSVEEAEVTLDGTVRHKADKRRIEDVADIDGVRHVQNNLRVRDRGHWTFL